MIRRNDLPETVPLTDRVQNLVYSSRSIGIDTVIVNGLVVVANGHSTLVDEELLLDRATHAFQRLMARIGHTITPTWRITG